MMTLSFLMYFFIEAQIMVQVAADAASDCADCTTAYKSDTDADCKNLKTYLKCLENAAGTTDWCTLSTEEAQKVTKATCTTTLVAPCSCLKDFWGSECRSLKQYTDCLKTAPGVTCESGHTASELVTRAEGRSDPKCSTSTSTTKTTEGTTPTTSAATTTGNKGSGASPLGMYSAIASFLPFVLTAFRL